MSDRADSHAHLFKPGWAGELPPSCRLMEPDETTVYEALAAKHNVKYLLAVGYQGEEPFLNNNAYLAEMAAAKSWVRPVAFFASPIDLTIASLEKLAAQKFVGISVYLFSDELTGALSRVSADVWEWMTRKRWLISVNSTAQHWNPWRGVLDRYPNLRLLVSHMGIPPAVEIAPNEKQAHESLATVLQLAKYPGAHVKVSGFYAMTKPGYDYPHRAAWPYVEALLNDFSADRLLWGSDFFPGADFLSFPQTYALFSHMPFLSDEQRRKIEGENLINLLKGVA